MNNTVFAEVDRVKRNFFFQSMTLQKFSIDSQADVVIMDFSKSFDLVPHQRFPSKLCHFEITGKLHNWI